MMRYLMIFVVVLGSFSFCYAEEEIRVGIEVTSKAKTAERQQKEAYYKNTSLIWEKTKKAEAIQSILSKINTSDKAVSDHLMYRSYVEIHANAIDEVLGFIKINRQAYDQAWGRYGEACQAILERIQGKETVDTEDIEGYLKLSFKITDIKNNLETNLLDLYLIQSALVAREREGNVVVSQSSKEIVAEVLQNSPHLGEVGHYLGADLERGDRIISSLANTLSRK